MKKKLRTWLAGVRSAFPTTFSPYWRKVPLGRMKMFLAGYFLVGAAGGFAFDRSTYCSSMLRASAEVSFGLS